MVIGVAHANLQPLTTLNIRVKIRKIGIRQHRFMLKHHDAFDDRDETAGIFEMAAAVLSRSVQVHVRLDLGDKLTQDLI
jgi:hypothetical protein